MVKKIKIEKHPFGDFIPKKARYLIVGSFPGPRKIWRIPWFYGSKFSQFWKIIEAVYGKEAVFGPLYRKKKLFSMLKIGLTDIFKACRRLEGNASNGNLVPVLYNDIPLLLKKNPAITTVLFTSVFVKDIFMKRFGGNYPGISLITLPSPSPRYAQMPLKKKIKYYRKHFPQIKKADERT